MYSQLDNFLGLLMRFVILLGTPSGTALNDSVHI